MKTETYIAVSGDYHFDGYGIVHVTLKGNARSIHGRWKGGRICLTVPPGISMTAVEQALEDFQPRLAALRPAAMYQLGQRLEFPEFSVEISSQGYLPDKIIMRYDHPLATVQVGSRSDISAHDTIVTISKFLCRIAQRIAPDVLISQAHQVSARVGKAPLLWTISNGHRTLGHCSAQGVIALSYALVFYPIELREYVICHELAHLTEMKHSERFHAICDAYCSGREAELSAAVRAHYIPIIK